MTPARLLRSGRARRNADGPTRVRVRGNVSSRQTDLNLARLLLINNVPHRTEIAAGNSSNCTSPGLDGTTARRQHSQPVPRADWGRFQRRMLRSGEELRLSGFHISARGVAVSYTRTPGYGRRKRAPFRPSSLSMCLSCWSAMAFRASTSDSSRRRS